MSNFVYDRAERITGLLEKLEKIPATGNNGYVRFDCLRPAQVRRLNQFKPELLARGNVVFTAEAIFTAKAYAIVAAQAAAQARTELMMPI